MDSKESEWPKIQERLAEIAEKFILLISFFLGLIIFGCAVYIFRPEELSTILSMLFVSFLSALVGMIFIFQVIVYLPIGIAMMLTLIWLLLKLLFLPFKKIYQFITNKY